MMVQNKNVLFKFKICKKYLFEKLFQILFDYFVTWISGKNPPKISHYMYCMKKVLQQPQF